MAEMTVGIRELKAQLSKYLHQVASGSTLVITDHGKPVGRIVPMQPSVEARVQELVQAGIVSWSGRRLSAIAPVAYTRGPRTVAELLLEDRE
jgi:prevent-host-death family protein